MQYYTRVCDVISSKLSRWFMHQRVSINSNKLLEGCLSNPTLQLFYKGSSLLYDDKLRFEFELNHITYINVKAFKGTA